jgi:extracellular elastinolytic metalloproteinase
MNTFSTLLLATLFLSAANLSAADRLKVPSVNPQPANRVVSSQSVKPDANAFPASPRDTALAFAKKQFNLKEGDFSVKNAYASHNGVTHVYLKQLLKGIEITNADMNINVAKDGTILSYGSTFLPITAQVLAKSKAWDGATRKVSPAEAFKTFARYVKLDAATVKEAASSDESTDGKKTYKLTNIPFARNDVPVDQAYIQTAEGALLASWRMQVPLSKNDNYFHVHVAADGSKVVRLIDWTKDASYNVLKLGDNDLDGAKRTIVKDPAHPKASPKGWHDQDGGKTFTNTVGNNVYAQENWDGGDLYLDNKRPSGGASLNFDTAIDVTKEPKTYYEAAVTNLFYMNNIMHDVFYQYGFDEQSGNFQQSNLGKGGLGNDAVIANAQDGSGTNNANFESPPDGQNGRMRMYVFDTTTPNRDGDLCNDIIQHEYGHGISTRLTGGPANSDCLNDGESGGMGEGWSDFFAVMLQQKSVMTSSTNFKMGAYVFNGKTIRNYEYSTSLTTNPTTYAYINKFDWQEVHAIGEIWANILYEAYWSLRAAMNGAFNADWYSADKASANTLILQLVMDGIKLQPCNPTFVDARDAIIKAEQVATGGKYKCALWKAFAKRGLGAKAKSVTNGSKVTADKTVPTECPKEDDQ